MGESDIVNSLNDFFKRNDKKGIAYRRKQSRFSSQFCDILVDTAENDYCDLAIEHKSFKLSSSKKLYFSSHFSEETNADELEAGHQIDRIAEFAKRSGKKTYLAVELRRGRGKKKELYFITWNVLVEEFEKWKDDDEEDFIAGLSRDWLYKNGIKIERDQHGYIFTDEIFQ